MLLLVSLSSSVAAAAVTGSRLVVMRDHSSSSRLRSRQRLLMRPRELRTVREGRSPPIRGLIRSSSRSGLERTMSRELVVTVGEEEEEDAAAADVGGGGLLGMMMVDDD